MKADDRDSMMVMGANAPALGASSRRSSPPQGRGSASAACLGSGGRRQAAPALVHRRVSAAGRRGGKPLGGTGRDRTAVPSRGAIDRAPLSAWRMARRRGALQGLTLRTRGAKPTQSNPCQCPGSPARSESIAPGEGLAPAPTMLAVLGNGAGRRGLRRNGANHC